MDSKHTYQNPTVPIIERVRDLLARMTLAEKIGQLTQVENLSITPAEARQHVIGSVLSGGGGNPEPNTPENWATMVRGYQEAALQTRLGIPLLYGADAVHGHNNVKGAVIFPHNIGLGATRDAPLAKRIGRITATEALATGIHWVFAPAVSIPRDIRWGRTYEGFSEDTGLVSTLGVAQLRGLQNTDGAPDLGHPRTVLASVKHFVGDGGTAWGSNTTNDWIIDQGVTEVDEATLRAIHLPPYVAAVEAGARNIMVSLSSWGGLRMHANRYLLTDVLKRELAFAGFLVSDWQAVDYIHDDYYTAVATSINAGVDMVMVPYDGRRFITSLTRAVEQGDVPLARINDAVRRILYVKFELGLFERPFGDESLLPLVGSEAHRAVAREAVRKSLVLLKNDGGVLPLSRDIPLIFVAGQAADDVGLQCGGWTIAWQGRAGDITPGTTLLAGIRAVASQNTTVRYDPGGEFEAAKALADVGIVVLSEEPYAEGEGDQADLTLPDADVALLARVRSRCRRLIVVLLSGRPLVVTEQLPVWDAFVAAWLPGTEGDGIAQVLFGEVPFTGKLPYTWPRSMAQVPRSAGEDPLFPLGYGLS
ncbi:MAG: glycoside hydrolase family 3 N-terminal domain-containing protein [Anaerolineae bacterium]|jgi:beta-glucosidase